MKKHIGKVFFGIVVIAGLVWGGIYFFKELPQNKADLRVLKEDVFAKEKNLEEAIP